MSNPKWTPGPWHWYGNKGLEAANVTVLCGDCGNAKCARTRLFISEDDARLIAQAPEMAAILRRIVDAPNDIVMTILLDEARAILEAAGDAL